MPQSQSYSNHTRLDPLFHFFILPVFAINAIAFIVQLVRYPSFGEVWLVILCIAALLAVLKARLYALHAQDRIIRLEQRLRLATVLPERLRTRISELEPGQLIGLRFAGDAELPALVERALNEKLVCKQIKQAVTNWQPDYFRI